MKKRLATCGILGAVILHSPTVAAVYDVQLVGVVRTVEGNAGGSGVFVGDAISASFKIDDGSYGPANLLPLGDGVYSIYSTVLKDLRFRVGSYSVSLPSSGATVTYMNNSFGSDGIVISPDTLPGGPFDSTRILPQFQFRGSSSAIGEGGVANGLPLSAFSPSLFVAFGNDVGVQRACGDLTVSISSIVPEPATWAMMLVGFGMVAGTARYRRRATKVAYV